MLKAKSDLQSELYDLIGQPESILIVDYLPAVLCDILPALADRSSGELYKQTEAVLLRCTGVLKEQKLQVCLLLMCRMSSHNHSYLQISSSHYYNHAPIKASLVGVVLSNNLQFGTVDHGS